MKKSTKIIIAIALGMIALFAISTFTFQYYPIITLVFLGTGILVGVAWIVIGTTKSIKNTESTLKRFSFSQEQETALVDERTVFQKLNKVHRSLVEGGWVKDRLPDLVQRIREISVLSRKEQEHMFETVSGINEISKTRFMAILQAGLGIQIKNLLFVPLGEMSDELFRKDSLLCIDLSIGSGFQTLLAFRMGQYIEDLGKSPSDIAVFGRLLGKIENELVFLLLEDAEIDRLKEIIGQQYVDDLKRVLAAYVFVMCMDEQGSMYKQIEELLTVFFDCYPYSLGHYTQMEAEPGEDAPQNIVIVCNAD